MKKTLSLFLSVIVMITTVIGIIPSVSAKTSDKVSSGYYYIYAGTVPTEIGDENLDIDEDGKDDKTGKSLQYVKWELDGRTKTLTFTGIGTSQIKSFSDDVAPEWLELDASDSITNIVFSNNIKSVGTNAFSGLENVKSISGNNVTYIGSYAFSNCSSLISIKLPKLKTIGVEAFSGCSSLSSFTVPNTTEIIGRNAFTDCESLRTVNGNAKVKIGTEAFSNCGVLSSFNLPYAKEIGSNCFLRDESLRTVSVPRAKLLKYALGEKEHYVTSLTCGSLDSYALYDCIQLKKLNIDNATYIGTNALYNCKNIGPIITAKKVTSIGDFAFSGLTNLQKAYFGKVTNIGSYAFSNCTNLVGVSFSGYSYAEGNGSSIKVIGTGAFLNCQKLSSTMKLKNVSTIGANAFANCKRIYINSLGKVCKSVGSRAFAGCNKITNLYFPNSVKTIGSDIVATAVTVNETTVTVTNNKPRIRLYYPSISSEIYKRYSKNYKSLLKQAVTSVTLNKNSISLKRNSKYKLYVKTYTPVSAVSKCVSYYSSNPKIATVDSNGYVVAKAKGCCNITVVTKDGSWKTSSCTVKVS